MILEKVTGFSDSFYAPLFHAAVISYGRPFVDNKSTGVLSRHWSDFTDARLSKTHKTLLKTRHELVAHSDSQTRIVHVIPTSADEPGMSKPRDHVSVKISSYYYKPQLFADGYDTCNYLVGRLSDRIDTLISELYDGLYLPSQSFKLDFTDGL
ncbi:hypothetical protein [Xanthomonas tesorieronis]|uniref:hypothetical protein n=1 Tax=Xanthomonas tesorieronis TaxID=3160839 RepID=UPI003519534A